MLNIKNNILFYSICAAIIISFFLINKFPFFADMTYISSVANFIYDNHLSQIIDLQNDNGTPPLMSIYFATTWILFGKTLFISHLAIFPFYIGLAYQFYKICLRFLNKNAASIATFLLIIDPAFSTQYILMGYDIPIVFLYILAINSIIDKKNIYLIISTSIITLLNLRGFSIVISIFLIDLLYNKKFDFKNITKTILKYIPALLTISFWIFYHFKTMGWFVINKSNINLHTNHGFIWIIKNFIFETLAILENGRVFIFISIISILIYLSQKRKLQFIPEIKLITLIILASLLPYFIIFTSLAYPVGPRYFMISYPFIYLLFFLVLNQLTNKKIQSIILISLSTIIFSSNFWVYKYPYSNSWDTRLNIISYFKIQNKLITKIQELEIAESKINSDFPLHRNFKYSYLDEKKDLTFKIYNEQKFENEDFIIYSNIYNNLILNNPIPQKNLKLIFTEQQMGIWIKLYKKTN